MKKFSIFVISALLILGIISPVWAEQSSSTASGKRYEENQVFTIAYNNSTSDMVSNAVVIIDTTGTVGSTLGAYITTTTTADSPYVFGVTDEAIAASQSGRVCIRGPHYVRHLGTATAGDLSATSGVAGVARVYATADATAGGYLGRIIAGAGNDVLVWVNPQGHK